jgi:hypothetical protein
MLTIAEQKPKPREKSPAPVPGLLRRCLSALWLLARHPSSHARLQLYLGRQFLNGAAIPKKATFEEHLNGRRFPTRRRIRFILIRRLLIRFDFLRYSIRSRQLLSLH